MSVTLSGSGVIELSETCTVEDAEALLQLLLAMPNAKVDWRKSHTAHMAVIQVLLVARAVPLGPPASEFLQNKIAPLLAVSLTAGST